MKTLIAAILALAVLAVPLTANAGPLVPTDLESQTADGPGL